MVTLKDIAKECKVSFSTVSKALKGDSEISAETQKLVQDMAKKMGYHPNLAARTLRTKRTFDIGVIFEDKTGAGFQHQYFATVLSGLQTVAQEKGYEITLTSTKSVKGYDYYNHMKGRGFDGVAILSSDFAAAEMKKLVQSDIPTVTLDFFYDKKHTAVMSNNIAGISELAEYVISMGHRKIAMIHGENTLVTKERIDSFKKTCSMHSITIPDEYFAEALYNDPLTSGEATSILLSLPEPPTCIFYPDDYSALGGIRELNARGLKAGKDISIVGYDGIMLTSMMIPPLTTYEQDGRKIGATIARNLIANIEQGDSYKPERELVSGRMLKGGTVTKIN
ncbi:MAG: LacI family DNA-binding transcriptional regulator [Treponema sp.]|nr:LacI family DNA-binding transcriptional regulator [Treponema sp.]